MVSRMLNPGTMDSACAVPHVHHDSTTYNACIAAPLELPNRALPPALPMHEILEMTAWVVSLDNWSDLLEFRSFRLRRGAMLNRWSRSAVVFASNL